MKKSRTIKKQTETEVGLFNLLTPEKKAAQIARNVQQELAAFTATLDATADKRELMPKVVEAYFDIMHKYYGSQLKMSFKGIIWHSGEEVATDGQICVLPQNLTSFILNAGHDIPSPGIPEQGSWEGLHHIYTFRPATSAVELPYTLLEDKLTV